MEDSFGAGDVGKEAANAVTVDADRGLFGTDDVGEAQTVGFEEGGAEKRHGDFEAYVFEVVGWCEAAFAELIDVEGELGLDVGVGVFGVVHGGAVLLFELGELDGDGLIDGVFMTEAVADVVGEGANGEGELIGGFRVAKEREDEVAGADVVGEFGEEGVAEGVVAEVLNGAATVGVGVGFLELGFSEGGVLLEEEGADGLFPGEVDELLMSLNGVGDGWSCREKQCQGRYRFEEGGAAWGGNIRIPSDAVVLLFSHTLHSSR